MALSGKTNTRAMRHGAPLAVLLLLLLAGCVTPREFHELDLDLIPADARQAQLSSLPPAGPLPLATAIERARAADSAIAVLKTAHAAAVERKNAAGDLIEPELRMSYADETSDATENKLRVAPASVPRVTRTEETSQSPSVGLRFYPPHPWVREARVSAGEASANATRLDIQAAEWASAMQVSRLFTDVRHFSRDAALLDQLVAVQDDNLKLFTERAQAATELEVLNAMQRRLQTLTTRDRVRRALRESQRNLAGRVNLPIEKLVLAESKDPLSVASLKNLTAAQLDRKALLHRADLSALHWRNLAAQTVCDAVRAERLPWFSFIQASCASGQQRQFASDSESISHKSTAGVEWRVDVGIALPLFTWSNHTLALREAEQRQAEMTLRAAITNACRSIEGSLSALQSLGERQAQYSALSEPALRQFEATLQRLDKEPGMSPDQIIAAREQFLNLRRCQLEQEYEYQKGVNALEEALGTWLAPLAAR